MSKVDDQNEPDLKHPRRRYSLFGQLGAEARLLEAYRSGKMHHGWILGGPEGIGKATLAYRFARFILCHPNPYDLPDEIKELAVSRESPVARRVAAEGHSDLRLDRTCNAGISIQGKTRRYEFHDGKALDT